MLQLAPAFKVAGQLLVWAKSPLAAMPFRVRVPPPLLVKVTDWAPLVVPTFCVAKVRLPGFKVTAGVVEVTTLIVDPALYKAPESSHTCVRITWVPVATVTFMLIDCELDICLKTTTSSTYTYIAEIATPDAGVAEATKFTGEVTVAPLAGAHTTTPGAGGGEQAEDVPVPESETRCGLPAAESVIV